MPARALLLAGLFALALTACKPPPIQPILAENDSSAILERARGIPDTLATLTPQVPPASPPEDIDDPDEELPVPEPMVPLVKSLGPTPFSSVNTSIAEQVSEAKKKLGPAPFVTLPAADILTPEGRELIVEFEVGGREGYDPHPEWPAEVGKESVHQKLFFVSVLLDGIGRFIARRSSIHHVHKYFSPHVGDRKSSIYRHSREMRLVK